MIHRDKCPGLTVPKAIGSISQIIIMSFYLSIIIVVPYSVVVTLVIASQCIHISLLTQRLGLVFGVCESLKTFLLPILILIVLTVIIINNFALLIYGVRA